MIQGTLRDTFHRWLDESDAVLVDADAGLSAAAGYDYDYGGTDRFREPLPALHRLGPHSRYLLGVPLPPDMMWGHWAVHITGIRYGTGLNPLPRRLRDLVGPVRPNCGGEVFPNVRVGPWFVDDAFMPTGERLAKWLSQFQVAEWLSHSTADRTTRTTPADHSPGADQLAKWPSGQVAKWPSGRTTQPPPTRPTPPRRPTHWPSGSATQPPSPPPTPPQPPTHWPGGSATQPLSHRPTAATPPPGAIRHPLENLVRHTTPGTPLVHITPDHPAAPTNLGGRAQPAPVRADDFLVP
ncbi:MULTISPECIES: hypothetical protein [unclassified Streptomyces]|uniref:hypothetical protein n=1 Tax=unclassified Streptomyces TaxID=2593676 RepID=UPI0013A6C073|nr:MULTISPECIES: hypothetical protein [unclassified Streptomyces]QZZ30509.1 hypothetical protein A7X85_33555 [Streptomyces sp. ST1015]